MKTMDIIFNDEGYSDELLEDISVWRHENGLPRAKVIVGVVEDNVDEIDYYVITVNETIFSYLMLREFGMSEKYGHEGWNGYIESNYNCETA